MGSTKSGLLFCRRARSPASRSCRRQGSGRAVTSDAAPRPAPHPAIAATAEQDAGRASQAAAMNRICRQLIKICRQLIKRAWRCRDAVLARSPNLFHESYRHLRSGAGRQFHWRAETKTIIVELCRLAADDRTGFCHGNANEHDKRGKTRQASCRCDGTSPLCGSFCSEDPQCGSGDEVALQVEGVVDWGVHSEEALGRARRLEPL